MEKGLNQMPLFVLPPIGYIELLLSGLECEIMLGEQYEKQTYRSRFEIAGPQGRQLLSIPFVHNSTHNSIAEIQIDYSQNWNVKHWRSIETAYRRAPFFEFYAHYFEPLFTKRYSLLAEMSLETLHIILRLLKTNQKLILNTNYQKTLPTIPTQTSITYNQVFIEKNNFIPNLSILDLIFNEGPITIEYLNGFKIEII